jgi:hypothetical protein
MSFGTVCTTPLAIRAMNVRCVRLDKQRGDERNQKHGDELIAAV